MVGLPAKDPFLRPDSADYVDILTDMAVDLLREHGVSRLSVGALARRMNMSPQAVLNSYPRARVVELICIGFGRRWIEWTRPDRSTGLPTTLPRTPDEIHGVRVHLALSELVRGEHAEGRPDASAKLVGFHNEEGWRLRHAVEEVCDRPPTDHQTELTLTLVTGLRLRLATAGTTLTWGAAAQMLRQHVAQLVVDNQSREDTGVEP